MHNKPDDLYLDGGVLANLCVADAVEQILSAITYRPVLLPDLLNRKYPVNEADPGDPETDSNDEASVRHVEVRTLVDRGIFHPCPSWDSEHMRLVVELSDRLSDRMARLVAWALLCGSAIGSDDRRTRWLIEEHFPEIQLVTTPQLVQMWQVAQDLPDDDVALTIRQIRQRAFFVPPESDPLCGWWLSHLDDL